MVPTEAEVETRVLSEGRLYLALRGRQTRESFDTLAQCLDQAVTVSPDGKADIFIDAYQLHDFSPEFRECWVQWFGLNRRRLRRVVVLQNSTLVLLALTALNVATGGLVETFTTRTDFERAWWGDDR